MRFKYSIIIFTIIFPLFSQNTSSNEIDSLLNESHQKFSELKFIESSENADQALYLSNLNNYSKGIVVSKLYIAKLLIEGGLDMKALEYIKEVKEEPFFRKEIIPQVEYHRLIGRVYGNQELYTLAKKEFVEQLSLSENIQDSKKKELSKLWAYQNIEHLYFLQGLNDSISVYQELQEVHLSHFEEKEAFYNISALYSSKAQLYLSKGQFDAAAVALQKSIDLLEKYNFPYKYQNLQTLGDLEVAKGNVGKAILYYTEALENSVSLNSNTTSRKLHKRLAEYMLKNDTLLYKAKEHEIEYTKLNDSLINHNRMVVSTILANIIEDKDKASAQKERIFWCIVVGLIIVSILLGAFSIFRNRKQERNLFMKNRQLLTRTERIEQLEEEIESNIFQDIIELAKSNSPEFLPLFGEGYPEFVAAMKKINRSIRSTELYFCALAYLNFSTKDIASFTFVTVRAVQVRKNRMRKKYDIPSDVDFNEYFRSLVSG